AKLGVNLVRLHGAIFDEDDFRRPATDKITRIHQLLDALRAEGVYLALSGYFPLWIGLSPDDGIEGYWEGHPYSLAYFSDDFQAVQRGWWKELLTSRNPRTGVPLARDPALAMVELVNEDSMFCWTFQPYGGLPAAQTQLLE